MKEDNPSNNSREKMSGATSAITPKGLVHGESMQTRPEPIPVEVEREILSKSKFIPTRRMPTED